MIDRRKFLELAGLSAGLAAGQSAVAQSGLARLKTVAMGGGSDLTKLVDLRIGTGGHGHTFPGATVPFGAVQLSPDTFNDNWDHCSGYHHDDTSIMGFSHTHLSGTGCGDLLDILLVPRVGEVKLVPGTMEDPASGYRSKFLHADEHMEPGYYSVKLESGVIAELTATERTGLHCYTFPASDDAHILLDLHHSYASPKSPVKSAELQVVGSNTVMGGRTVKSWTPTPRSIYFAMEFSKPFTKAQVYSEKQPLEGTTANGTMLQCALHWKTAANEKLQVRVGISMVSAENAMKNLRKEQADWNFAKTRAAAKASWEKELNKVRIETADTDHKTVFYTAMYHMACGPTLADDVNGEYRGMDGNVHTLEAGQHNYSTFSLWDTFRALHPSMTLMRTERLPSMVNCLVRMAEESPAGMPVWPLQGGETGTMTGYHSATVMAEACVKKTPGVDWARAYKVMRKRNMNDDYRGLGNYRKLGFIPADIEEESVSKTLEYNYNDWACSHVAEAIGEKDDAALQRKRSQNYQNMWDPKTQFLRAKLKDGNWAEPFNPRGAGHTAKYRDYTESNAWQSVFGVQHDVKGAIDQFGGREQYVAKLDELFTMTSELPPDMPPDVSGMIGQYAHGNEPSHHITYLYTYAGQPWKTQQKVNQVLTTLYHNDPDGVAGNEDVGQMSAWYVMSSLGLYAVDPVSATYVLTGPLFDRASVKVAEGRELVIEAKRTSPKDIYVQSVELNGKPYDKLWVKHSDIAQGARLVFTMGPKPNTALGTEPKTAPPSLTV